MRDALALTVDERVEQALALGQRDLEFYMAANGVDRETAVRKLREVMRVGRRPSKCNDEL